MKEKLQTIIEKSSLKDSQKMLWMNIIHVSQPEQLEEILNAIESSTEDLNFLTENLEEKLKAITDPNDAKWQAIIQKEKEYLKKLTQL